MLGSINQVSDPTDHPAAAAALEGIGASAERWLEAFRSSVSAQKRIFAEHAGIEARTQYDGIGEGGDHTLVIDRLCEDAVFAELEVLAGEGHSFLAVSEERGEVAIGSGDPGSLRVVIDPIDGSLNARRTIPLHSLSIAVATGDSMEDVELGYVYEFGAGEELWAARGAGAMLDGAQIAVPEGDGLEVVAIEASKPERLLRACESLDGRAYRIRAPGSIAVSLAYVATGRFDGMFSSRPCRSVDAAAAQLILTEAGGHVFTGVGAAAGGEVARLDLDSRFDIAGARTRGDLEILVEARAAVG